MNQFKAVSTEEMTSVEDCIYGNVTKTMLMLQGVESNHRIRDGYSYYRYISDASIEAGTLSQSHGLICVTPANHMFIYGDQPEMYEKLDFFKLLREKSPKVIKMEWHAAQQLKRRLDKIKVHYSEKSFAMMKHPYQNPTIYKSQHANCDGDGAEIVTATTNLTHCAEFVIEAERHFGKNPSLVTDMRQIVSERISAGDYVMLKKDGAAACQGAVEFSGDHLAVLGNIYTSGRHRKQGLATAVTVELVVRCLQKEQVPYLFVLNENHQAIRLYEHLGFKKIRDYLMIEPEL